MTHQEEDEAARADTHVTLRPVSAGMESYLFRTIPILDHGFIRTMDYMGTDASIIQAARMSYMKGTRAVSDHKGLIRYLMRHWHSSPFEMCEVRFWIKAPIFVARQWLRHRTANVNEMSARYSILDREFYIPDEAHLAAQSQTNNQGRGMALSGSEAQAVLDMLREDCVRSYDHYEEMLRKDPEGEGKLGLARELARMNLPTNIYTQFAWKIDAHNLFHFLRLRADSHAQFEIRVYAEEMCRIVSAWLPHSYEAFEEYRLNAVTFSATQARLLSQMLDGTQPDTSMLSKGEAEEFSRMIGKIRGL